MFDGEADAFEEAVADDEDAGAADDVPGDCDAGADVSGIGAGALLAGAELVGSELAGVELGEAEGAGAELAEPFDGAFETAVVDAGV